MRLTHESVIEAASNIADTNGFNELSLKIVAEKLNIRTPSLYNHIASLDDLRLQVAHNGMRSMNVQMTQAALGFSDDAAIRAICEAYLKYVMAHPGVYEAIQWAHWHGNDDTETIFNQYKQLITRLIQTSAYQKRSTDDAIVLVMSLIHGFSSLQLGKALNNPDETTRDLMRIIDMALIGLRQV